MMKRWVKYASVIVCLLFSHAMLFAQPHDGKKTSKDASVTLRVEVTSPTTAMYVDLQKSADDKARLGTNQPGKIEIVRDGAVILTWDKSDSERVWRQYHKMDDTSANADKKDKAAKKEKNDVSDNKTRNDASMATKTVAPPVETRTPVGTETVIREFDEYMGNDSYFAEDAINGFQNNIDEHISNLRNWTDKDAYIAENELDSYARGERDVLIKKREELSSLVSSFLRRYKKSGLVDRDKCEQQLTEIAEKKLDRREEALSKLENELGITPPTAKNKPVKWIPIAICGVGALLLIILLTWLVKSRKKTNTPASVASTPPRNQTTTYGSKGRGNATAEPAIVVRRTTTTILKRQNLDDVIGNPQYFPIEVEEFCDMSAVKRIYLKNTCIKEIYEMYAKDLRNSPNPNENGCMVLGRWVYDTQRQEYCVSLEEVVMPGDDAVFQEYELNFGGKIKLRANGRLKKLREQTGLQYDLTCWVHSHPGLGVFFSNADTSVHHQLKHHTHPHFLTAIVVDILTKGQQLGIFVFKRDGSISSKNDLKKMYSLTKLYQWAVNSERNVQSNPQPTTTSQSQPQTIIPSRPTTTTPSQPSMPPRQGTPSQPASAFRPTSSPQAAVPQQPMMRRTEAMVEYIDILSPTAAKLADCHSIMVKDQAVEQLQLMTATADNGVLGFIHGTINGLEQQMACTVEKVSSQPFEPNMQPLGCVVAAAHLSLPSVRKAVAPYIGLLRFVMVYTSTDGMLTTIPVLRQELCIDEHFYGEQKLDDLISWAKNRL
ncbi:MAG: Mov34/MPN/PAD-1 family protein [Prevotella sp.]|nr:Mov34/MPN/PAD-1 family protein [Prevotella sp.]